jgi:hypothetical protein
MIHVITDASRQGEVMDDAHEVLSALRLGWSVADTYTELVAIAVQTAPPPPGRDKSELQRAIGRRELTPATPN